MSVESSEDCLKLPAVDNLAYPESAEMLLMDTDCDKGSQQVTTSSSALNVTSNEPACSNTSALEATSLIKCPPFCRGSCTVNHHPLLVAILNCVDTEEMELMDLKLNVLQSVIKKYKQNTLKWHCDYVIPDALQRFQYPMIHWACMLARVGAAVWLIGHQYNSPTSKAVHHQGSTGIHMALRCLQETCPLHPAMKFLQLLSVMEPAIAVPDWNGNTPLHLCCHMIRDNMPHTEFYKGCLIQMVLELSKTRNMENVASILNLKNAENQTALDFLHGCVGAVQLTTFLKSYGAKSVRNADLETTKEKRLRDGFCCVCIKQFSTKANFDIHLQSKRHVEHILKLQQATVKSGSCAKTLLQFSAPKGGQLGRRETPSPDQESVGDTDDISCENDSTASTSSLTNVIRGEPPLKRAKLDSQSNDNGSNTALESDTADKAPSPPPAIVLFEKPSGEEDDEAVQTFFEDVVKKHDKRRRIEVPACTDDEFLELVNLKEYAAVASHLLALMKHSHAQKVKKRISDLASLPKEAQEKIIELVLEKRETDVKNLRYTNRAIDCLKERLPQMQEKQEALVSEVLIKVENLGQLQTEEAQIDEDLATFDSKADNLAVTHCHLKERLANCEKAIAVLKRLHRETKLERRVKINSVP